MAQHRADRHTPEGRPATPGRRSGGRHRADDPVSVTPRPAPHTPFRAIRSLPPVVGAGVIALAAVGAVLIGPTAPQRASAATAAPLTGTVTGRATAAETGMGIGSGTDGVSSVVSSADLDRRELAVSRDSQREALADAADQRLQAATERQAQQRDAALKKLAARAERQAGLIARDSWQLPVPHGAYRLTAGFGSCSGLWAHCHTGLDFAAPTGTPIHAVAAGTITGTGPAGAYGNRTIETLPDGTQLWYCHQSAFAVTPGQKVGAGQVIGRVGSTGNTTGPHVHLEVRPGAGDPVDPYAALVQHGLHP